MNKQLTLAVPTVVAIIGVAIVSSVTIAPHEGSEVSSAPTAYSQDHARVQSRAGEPEPLPPQF